MQYSGRTYLAYAFCFLSFAAFGYYHMQFNTDAPQGKTDLASEAEFETPQQCGDQRNYLEKDLLQISPEFRNTRQGVEKGQPPRQCVSYIMKNFASLDTPMSFRSQCRNEKGEKLAAPVRSFKTNADGKPEYFQAPCVTEPYVNSVYNSLVDVAECFNIPLKELFPKLFNESGLHINTWASGGDSGVGQLTDNALSGDVFERYNGEDKNPSGFEWYVAEMLKSDKPSCKRIANVPEAFTFAIPTGQKLCSTEEAQNDPKCYRVWRKDVRCEFLAVPANPLRNVLTTAILYKNNQQRTTGIVYKAGVDYLDGQPYQKGTPYGGYIRRSDYVERMRKLGVSHPDQEVIKQMIMSLGFNAGIAAPKNILDDYLTFREKSQMKLADSDFNFQDTDTGKWAVLTNFRTFWKGLSGSNDDYRSALKSVEVFNVLKMDAKKLQGRYSELRTYVQKQFKGIDKLPVAEQKKIELAVQTYVEKERKTWLDNSYEKAARLTFPEFVRIGHAKKAGGAPGYLSFIAVKYVELEKKLGHATCTEDKYLKF